MCGDGFMRGEDVADRFRHLLLAHRDIAVMQPVGGHDIGAMRAAGLRDLVFMMRKDKVQPAGANVES